MESNSKQLICVTYTYSDGTEKYIDKDELTKWIEFNAIVVRHAAIDKINPNWEDIKWRDSAEQIFY